MEIARLSADAVFHENEYELLKAFFIADGKKAIFRRALELLEEGFRDACVLRLGIDKTVGCMPEISAKLAGRFSIDGCREIYELLGDYINRLDANTNLTLTMNSLFLICFFAMEFKIFNIIGIIIPQFYPRMAFGLMAFGERKSLGKD